MIQGKQLQQLTKLDKQQSYILNLSQDRINNQEAWKKKYVHKPLTDYKIPR